MLATNSARRAYTFIEVGVAIVLAGIIATIAVQSYAWIYADTAAKIVRLDAQEFERSVRALANSELRAPSGDDASTVAEQMAVEKDLTITGSGNGYTVTRNGASACVVLGEGLNTEGTVTEGSCP
jgi:type II secretory pathway pseudopilin PulG